ncbi:MAG: COX15/CtaA family protein [Planctomycetota bacterium]
MNVAVAEERRDGHVVLAVGFGTTVFLWALCYLFRLPGLALSSPALGALLLVTLAGGGIWAGRHANRALRAGLLAGLVTAALNLMIVGSVSGALADDLQTSIPIVLGGVLLSGAMIGAGGGWLGGRFPSAPDPARWRAALPKVAPAATFLLIILGGVVTSTDTGLAVYDWPTTFGSNMFLFPLSKMVGGVFYEHAHRLFGSLVGWTTIALAVHLVASDRRRWVKACAIVAVLLVVSQGILGAYRVTEAEVAPGVEDDTTFARWLAVFHGVSGQAIFGLLVAIAAVTSRTWQRLPGLTHPKLRSDQRMAVVLVLLVLSQLGLGAMLRHFGPYSHTRVDAVAGDSGNIWVMVHMVWAFAVLGHGLFVSARSRALYDDRVPIRRTSAALLWLFLLQIGLGFAALVVTAGDPERAEATARSVASVLIPTAHQALGAAILGVAVMHALWLLRAGAHDGALASGPDHEG